MMHSFSQVIHMKVVYMSVLLRYKQLIQTACSLKML